MEIRKIVVRSHPNKKLVRPSSQSVSQAWWLMAMIPIIGK
jgi:hypothetical protein